MLPIDIILVRHGQSEGNVAQKASRKGDNQFFTPEFRDRHSRAFHEVQGGDPMAGAGPCGLRGNTRGFTQWFDLPEHELHRAGWRSSSPRWRSCSSRTGAPLGNETCGALHLEVGEG